MTADDAGLNSMREAVRKLLAASYGPARRRALLDDPSGLDGDSWRLMTEQLGLTGLGVPEQYGGAGAGAEVVQVVAEELGAALYGSPYLACAGLATPALLRAGDEDARTEFLPRIADGSLIATLALTESGRSWDVADIATAARQVDGRTWRVSGHKAYVLDAGVAALALVSARTAEGIGLFAVELDAPGVEVTPTDAFDLTRRLSSVHFSDVAARRVSGDGDATDAIADALDLAMVTITGEQVGGALACLAMAVDYARQREQFGSAIGAFQAVKHLCAEMLTDVEAATALAHRLARSVDAGEPLALHASAAKAMCSDTFFTVAARMIQIHGGIGFTWEHDAHLYYRRAKAMQLLFGDATRHRSRIADLLEY
jgi:alkylation response protein AidB-like acyl-CoA dehydrogenase